MPADRLGNTQANTFGRPVAGDPPDAGQARRLRAIGDPVDERGDSGHGNRSCGCHEAGLRAVLRNAVRARVKAWGEAEVRQRELHEWVVLLVALTVTVMLAAPAMVPLVLALQGQRP